MDNFRKIYRDGFCVSPRRESEIRNIAEQVRKLAQKHDFKYFDVTRFLEFDMPLAFEHFRYEIVEPRELPDREAEMSPRDYSIRVQEPVYIKALEGDGHCRFTLAHEIGHFLLHRTQTLAFGRQAQDGKIPAYRHSEWQADVFARNLLAPLSLAKNMIAAEIAEVFGVSKEVACIISGEKPEKQPICHFNTVTAPVLPGLEMFC